MYLLFAPLTVRWISVMTGAAHVTTALRHLDRIAPEVEDDLPPDAIVVRSEPPLRPASSQLGSPRPQAWTV